MSKTSNTTLQKLERILTEAGYILRFERGTFQSGYCILEQKKVVVLNKFLDADGRTATLYDLIPNLTVNFDALTHESQKLYSAVVKQQSATP
jgi:hypothetical protein